MRLLPTSASAFAAVLLAVLLVPAAEVAHAPPGDAQALGQCLPDEWFAQARDPAEEILVRHLSRRFFVATDAIERVVRVAYRAAPGAGLDPLLVLAVIAVESRYNPIAESAAGARGLMQVIPRYHRERLLALGGEQALLDPEANIVVGVAILREYVHRAGTLEAALQFYGGATRDAQADYARRVLAERSRLLELVPRRS